MDVARIRAFWRRTVVGPGMDARMRLYEELASLLAAGIGLREALGTLRARHGGARRRALDVLAAQVERGEGLAAGMRAHPEVFTALEAALVATGAQTGRLDEALRAAAGQLDRQRKARNRVIAAFAYPLFLVHFAICVPTLGLIAAREGLGAWLAFVVPAIGLLWAASAALVSLHVGLSGSPRYGKLLLSTPALGRTILAAAVARFARALASLHGAGVTHGEALRDAAEAAGNGWLRREALDAGSLLAEGENLATALAAVRSLPQEEWSLVASGEQSGNLEDALLRVAALEEERFDASSRRALALLPGCLVALVGLVVAWMAFRVIGGYYRSVLDLAK